jgi:hypothetical protein
MLGVDGHAVGTDAIIETAIFLKALFGVVAVEAQALEIAEPELPLISLVRFDVIDHACSGDLAPSSAGSAERLDPQLMARHARPSGSVVKAIPWRVTFRQKLAHGDPEGSGPGRA